MVEKSCGLEFEQSTFCFSKISFHGYDSIKSENSLKDLTGTTFQIFNFFLTLLPQSNRLIIVLGSIIGFFLQELGHLISNTEIISPFLKIKPSGLAQIQVCNPYKTFDAPFPLISISFIKYMANLFLLSSDVDFNVFIL
ncbi:hypothetical protein QTP88_011742 [Uroleucon formosanum]